MKQSPLPLNQLALVENPVNRERYTIGALSFQDVNRMRNGGLCKLISTCQDTVENREILGMEACRWNKNLA